VEEYRWMVFGLETEHKGKKPMVQIQKKLQMGGKKNVGETGEFEKKTVSPPKGESGITHAGVVDFEALKEKGKSFRERREGLSCQQEERQKRVLAIHREKETKKKKKQKLESAGRKEK